jgi:hypothetical protein
MLRKAVHNWVKTRGKRFAENAGDAEVAETTVKKTSMLRGFDALVKQWDKCINVGGGYVEK